MQRGGSLKALAIILDQTLSQQQRLTLLARVLARGGDRLFDRVSPRLDEDLAKAWKTSLQAWQSNRPAAPSGERCLETWRTLQRQVDDIVSATSDEEGRYILQEHHWEPPDLDGYGISSDLEKVAIDMLPLVRQVHALGEGGPPFTPEELSRALESLPDWMGVMHRDGVSLGPASTHLLALWTWLEDASPDFISNVESAPAVSLDGTGLRQFAEALPEDEARALHSHLDGTSDTLWSRARVALAGRFNPTGWLKAASKHLAVDWTVGLPILKTLVSEGKFKPARKLCEDIAKAASLCPGKGVTERLVEVPFERNLDVSDLLRNWRIAAEANEELLAAIDIQVVALQAPQDWDSLLSIAQQVRKPSTVGTCDLLIADWIRRITKAHWDASWVRWLLEDHVHGGDGLLRNLPGWLATLKPAGIVQHSGLKLLTDDLLQGADVLPRLRSEMATHDPFDTSRRAWWTRRQRDELLPVVMAFWKKHLPAALPDPASASKSRYDWHARWLAVLHELDPAAARKAVRAWQTCHARRINLWAAVRQLNIPDLL